MFTKKTTINSLVWPLNQNIFIKDLLYTHTGEGSGTPLQYSCLQNPVDGRAW